MEISRWSNDLAIQKHFGDPASMKMWESNGAFHAEVDPDKKPFTIVMPPPNITGQLHMGHALDQTLQDVLDWRLQTSAWATVLCGCRGRAIMPASPA